MGVIGEGEQLGFDVATLGEVGCEVDALEAEEEGHRAPARGFLRGRFGAGFHSIPGEPVSGDFDSAMFLSHSLASTNSSIETTMAAKKNRTCFLFRRISMFKSLHQGSRSYYEYLQIAKVWADQLAIVGIKSRVH